MATFEAVEDSAPGTKRGPGRPRGGATTTATKVVPKVIPDAQLHDALAQNLVFLSMGVGLFDKTCNERQAHDPGHETCSVAIASQASTIATSLVEASKKNPALRRILNMIVTTSVFGQVAAALMPVVFTIARNHVAAFQVDNGPDLYKQEEQANVDWVRMNGTAG